MKSDTPSKNIMKRSTKITLGVVVAVVVLLLLGVGSAFSFVNRMGSASTGQSDEAFKSNFLSSCRQGVINEGGKTEFAYGYCGCVYDDAVKQFGTKGLATQASMNGGQGSAQFRELATACGERYKDFQG